MWSSPDFQTSASLSGVMKLCPISAPMSNHIFVMIVTKKMGSQLAFFVLP